MNSLDAFRTSFNILYLDKDIPGISVALGQLDLEARIHGSVLQLFDEDSTGATKAEKKNGEKRAPEAPPKGRGVGTVAPGGTISGHLRLRVLTDHACTKGTQHMGTTPTFTNSWDGTYSTNHVRLGHKS